ncbi:MFS transporter [Lentzea flaviverrucosa]|uniref:Predicted arabinose efflux permease, MFS family n=1 Tax=Lentzea flaviverrucosa TaxID=200379 RepID=A0A1H9CYA4_9PSEU|nr:MFS transporter [Lentzea flaviverrucosa]RDI24684.1 putative MFS family arabinose efflux permease [Lentzea flaviverrucosa]SEQ06119.1 Predicted arabinose efflux permease, MFS family [Lentzea flaviverrucosa]
MGDRGGAVTSGRDFGRYLNARVLSVVGAVVSAVALPVLVYQLTGSAGWTAAVTAAEALPYLVFGLPAGALADRLDRRLMMVAMDFTVAAVLLSVPLAWLAGGLTAPHVVVVAFATQTAFVFFDAANFGALPALVGKEKLTAAFSTLYGRTTVVELVVPGVTGLLVTIVAPAALLAVNALTAVGSALLLRAIASSMANPRPVRGGRELVGDVREGLRFLWHEPIIRLLTLVGATHSVASGAWMAVLVPFADQVLGVAPKGDARLAVLFTCWGVGAVVASRVFPKLTARWGNAKVALAALPLSLLCGVLVLVSGHWLVLCGTATCWGVTGAIAVINGITYRQQVCPDDLQSRVNTTARMVAWGLGQPLGAALAGVLSVATGDPRAGLGAGLAVLLAGVVAAWVSPVLRGQKYRNHT